MTKTEYCILTLMLGVLGGILGAYLALGLKGKGWSAIELIKDIRFIIMHDILHLWS